MAEGGEGATTTKDGAPAPPDGRARVRLARGRAWARGHRTGVRVGAAALVVLLVGAVLLVRYLRSYEATDDAQVDGHIVNVSARLEGTVQRVLFEENQRVRPGDLLVELDPRDHEVALERARAELAQAQAALAAAHRRLPITSTTTSTQVSTAEADRAAAQAGLAAARRELDVARAALVSAQATDARAQAERARYRYLLAQNAATRQVYEDRVAAARSSAASVMAAQARVRSARQGIDQAQSRLAQAESRTREATQNAPQTVETERAAIAASEAAVAAAQAGVRQAALNVSYTQIRAPARGVVGRRAAEPGQRVQPGQALVALVALDDLWVTANFKETQLRRISAGQSARVAVDAFGEKLDAYVDSLGGATGARFSVLPPENATGNYVKVVQRVPVRLRFRQGQAGVERLRPGLSVVPKVWLR